jgi:hypothetical protein
VKGVRPAPGDSTWGRPPVDERNTVTVPQQPTSMRTHLCGALRADDVGSVVRLCGWVAKRREHGEHLAFVDLRDHTGHRPVRRRRHRRRAQRVRDRRRGDGAGPPRGHGQPRARDRRVELAECTVEVLNPAEPPPFPSTTGPRPTRSVRLRYRYVDLRRPACSATCGCGPGQRRHAGGHGRPGLRRGRDAAPVDADPGGGPRVRGAVANCSTDRSTSCPRARRSPSSC